MTTISSADPIAAYDNDVTVSDNPFLCGGVHLAKWEGIGCGCVLVSCRTRAFSATLP